MTCWDGPRPEPDDAHLSVMAHDAERRGVVPTRSVGTRRRDHMSVRVHIPTPMRQHTQGQAVVDVSGSSVQSALDDLGKKFDGITQRIFENGQIRRFVNVYLNDEDIRYLDNLATPVKDGDELSIIPAVAGG